MRADLGGVKQVAWAKPTAVNLEVSPTGNGPADAEVCEAFETNISNQQGNFVDAVLDGDIGRAARTRRSDQQPVGHGERGRLHGRLVAASGFLPTRREPPLRGSRSF